MIRPPLPPETHLSRFFTLREMCFTAHRAYVDRNWPPEKLLPALRATCALLETVRSWWGEPLIVHSGYRTRALNAAIGGSPRSQHCLGEAADFHIVDVPLEQVWARLRRFRDFVTSPLFGQAILEGYAAGAPSWIHLSLGPPWRPAEKSGQMLLSEDGGKTYQMLRAG